MHKFFMVILTFISLSSPAFASELPPEIKILMSKFGLAMLGVAGFSLLLFGGLSLYNKFFVDSQIKDFNLRKDSLRTPVDKDEAIISFITRCRLK